MNTITDILTDIDRGCMANNIIEDCFTYRIIYYVNVNNTGRKYYEDCTYRDLRKALENIIKGNLTVTNNVVVAATTNLKNGRCVYLQSKAYTFSLADYFKRINGDTERPKQIYNRCAG